MPIWPALVVLAPVLQNPVADDKPVWAGPGITQPQPVRRVDARYSPQALSAHIQGTVVLEIVVDASGSPRDIAVISPVGFGLDEEAQRAVGQWKFKPATRDGVPVPVYTDVEVDFRLNRPFDEEAERRRAQFNEALRDLRHHPEVNTAPAIRAIRTMVRLADKNFAPAMHAVSLYLEEGRRLPRDSEQALKLLLKAAAQDYGPALYTLGRRYLEGNGVPNDREKGEKLIREAALLGSIHAQFYLGSRYAADGPDHDPERARRYFRLCAAYGSAECQFWLGAMLLLRPDREERHYLQAIAWLELADAQRFASARTLLDQERPKLSPRQVSFVNNLKSVLVRNPA
jgi:TonB family protein